MNTSRSSGLVEVNGNELYHEVRGSGPPMLFISGGTGDAGHFEPIAESLADEFTVVNYDRRGNSRSPRPEGWRSTSTGEQADDAAKLIEVLGLTPAAVFASSTAAPIGLDLVIRHREGVTGAILHDPPLMSALAEPEKTVGAIQEVVESGMQRGGPPAAVEAFVRFAIGDDTFEDLDPRVRERVLGNGEVLFGLEFGAFESYHLYDDALATVDVPVQVMVSTNSAPFFSEAARWLAARLGVALGTLPGGHAAYLDRPEDVAEAIRPFLRRPSKANGKGEAIERTTS